jgi:hypothetical protein
MTRRTFGLLIILALSLLAAPLTGTAPNRVIILFTPVRT